MKISKTLVFLAAGLVLCVSVTGCKKRIGRTTPLPNSAIGGISNPGPRGLESGVPGGTGLITDTTPITPSNLGPEGTIPGAMGDIDGRPQDREIFAAHTVYFDFDSSTVRAGEEQKVRAVAEQFKSGDPANDLLVEGHCDDRGTEEYNRALGERRAQAIREHLVRLGVNPEKVHTKSYGEDKPAVEGQGDAVWSRNRRGEFVLVLPRR